MDGAKRTAWDIAIICVQTISTGARNVKKPTSHDDRTSKRTTLRSSYKKKPFKLSDHIGMCSCMLHRMFLLSCAWPRKSQLDLNLSRFVMPHVTRLRNLLGCDAFVEHRPITLWRVSPDPALYYKCQPTLWWRTFAAMAGAQTSHHGKMHVIATERKNEASTFRTFNPAAVFWTATPGGGGAQYLK